MAGNDGNTIVLMHFNGADASTTMTDDAYGGAHTWTAAGNAQLDTAQSKFGGASLHCDGTGDYVTTADSNNFTPAGDFTVDCWFRIGGGSGRRWLFGNVNAVGNAYSMLAEIQTNNTFRCIINTTSSPPFLVSTSTFSVGQWVHVAVVRTGNIAKLFINGVQEGGDFACVGALVNPTAAFSVGRGGDFTTLTWNGHIDEFRFSNVARWTANFTPPTAAYDEFVDGVLSVSASATVSFAGPNTLSITAGSTASFVGVGGTALVLNASGIATPAFKGASEYRAALSATAQAALDLRGASEFRALLSSTGISANSFVSAADKAAILNSDGVADAVFRPSSYLFSSGQATVLMKGNAPGNAEFFIDGISDATFEGRSEGSCTFTIEATCEATYVGDYNKFTSEDGLNTIWSPEDAGGNGWVEESASGGNWS